MSPPPRHKPASLHHDCHHHSLSAAQTPTLGTVGIHLSQPGMFETLPNPEAQNLPCLDLLRCPRTHADLLTSCVGHNHLMTFPRSPGEMLSRESALENR